MSRSTMINLEPEKFGLSFEGPHPVMLDPSGDPADAAVFGLHFEALELTILSASVAPTSSNIAFGDQNSSAILG